MKEFDVYNGGILKDGATSAMFLAARQDGKQIVVHNCHLTLSPFLGMRSPCLFGTHIEVDKIYRYKPTYIIKKRNDLHKIITK